VLLSAGSVVLVEFLRDTVLTPRELQLLTGKRVLASLPNTGRTPPREVFVVPESAPETEWSPAPDRRLAQPKIVSDPVLEWASGE